MKLKDRLIKINDEIKPYHSFLVFIVFILSTFVIIYNFLIKPTDLNLVLTKENVEYPSFINEDFGKVFLKISDLKVDDSIKYELVNIQSYLMKSKNHWKLELKNMTSRTINKIDLRILNVNSLASFNINSDYLTKEEKTDICQKLSYQKDNGIISLANFTNIPPNRFIIINLWGELNYVPFQNNIFATYEGGEAKIVESKTVSGFILYVIDYFIEIQIALFLSFFLLYRYSIKKYKP